jgi:molybdate transport system regulatory protein
MTGVRLTVRIDFGSDRALGPGKVRLLETIERTGSISQAGRTLGMSYRRAWLLVDDLNRCFRQPVVTTKPGGARGGGAALTRFGRALIKSYRSIEAQAATAGKKQLRNLEIALRHRGSGAQKQKRLKTSIRATAPQR